MGEKYFKIFIFFTAITSASLQPTKKCLALPGYSVLRCGAPENLPQQLQNGIELIRFEDSTFSTLKADHLKNFPYLRNLQAGSSGIETIEDNTFHNKTHLERINISNNKLKKISPDLLQNCPQIFELDLSGNRELEVPNDKSFLNTPVLRSLTLSRCNIEKVSSFTFKNLTGLEYLSLAENNIETLPDNVFESNTKLYSIDLSGNKMKTISRQVFSFMPVKGTHLRFTFLDTLIFPRLENNPWECNCALYPMIQWYKKEKQNNQNEEITCTKPDNKKWKEIQDLNCANNNTGMES